MSSVPSSSSSFWTRLFGGSRAVLEGTGEEDDEALVWGNSGGFKWEDIEGVEVEWGSTALGAIKKGNEVGGEEKVGDGMDDIRRFIWES